MKFSIIIRTKNRPLLLVGAVESVLKQSYPNFEIIIVNDGGKDVKRYLPQEAMQSVQYIRNPISKGKSEAANQGARAATGDYLCLLDEDDEMYSNHLQVLKDYLQEHPDAQYCYTDTHLVRMTQSGQIEDQNEIHSWSYDPAELAVMKGAPILCSVCFKKELWNQVGGYDSEFKDVLDDWVMYRKVAERTSFHHIPTVTAEYRLPAIHKAFEKGEKFKAAIDKMVEKYPSRGYHLSAELAARIAKERIEKDAMIEGMRRILAQIPIKK